ncbi:DUF1622 domain-containing protein [Enterococcus casseliflavus]|uniref:DUF1622 domain-containing protein n=1 Tax=Enterococcus casseliflavus TaxID=37734 RepID=UPI001157590B|nr:DUF1622 domain-containing protein [Enterococcus casseliflavus]
MHNLADSLMTGANPIFDFIVVCLNFLSIFVIVWGVLISGIDFVRYELTEKDRLVAARENNFIRNYLGSYVLLGLEILIAADIIETIIHPTFEDIVRLAAVVIIRTVISYFLNKEIERALQTTDHQPAKKKEN